MKSEKENPSQRTLAPIGELSIVRKDTNFFLNWRSNGIELENDWRRNEAEF